MKKVWKILNAPLVVVVIAILIWPTITIFSGSYAISKQIDQVASSVKNAFKGNSDSQLKKTREYIEIRKVISIKNARVMPGDWKNKEKVIATIKNGSVKNIKTIRIGASYYDKAGELIDVGDEWLHSIKVLGPGESVDIKFDRILGDHQLTREELAANRAASIKLRINSFDVIE